MHPGDLLHVSAGTNHSFRFDAHYTRFFSVLATVLLEEFFNTLGAPYADGFIFPPEGISPLRMARTRGHGREDLKSSGLLLMRCNHS
jgi:hypothetical protein